jgi:hypothetical protein
VEEEEEGVEEEEEDDEEGAESSNLCFLAEGISLRSSSSSVISEAFRL